MAQKSVAAIHDISGFGRCSLTVALPLLSAAGIQTSVIPTAVLSTCTGEFKGNTFHDLTRDIEPIAEHWKREGLQFDAIYTGYMCNASQVYSVMSALGYIKSNNTFLLVDPVMGDNGKLYSGFSVSFTGYMLRLCQKADIITPNITEAALLAGMPYMDGACSEEYVQKLATTLYERTRAKIVLTGVSFEKKKIGVAIFDGNEITYFFTEKQPASFHSTGDVFASVLTAALLSGRSLKAAAQVAVNFTAGCIRQTIEDKANPKFGVNFEQQIPNLIKYLQ
ncbi:MAG: pyridoxamine kinase [Clostridia bacterium]|nr:pyridoxamine kinase [Clostridia bacterium]